MAKKGKKYVEAAKLVDRSKASFCRIMYYPPNYYRNKDSYSPETHSFEFLRLIR